MNHPYSPNVTSGLLLRAIATFLAYAGIALAQQQICNYQEACTCSNTFLECKQVNWTYDSPPSFTLFNSNFANQTTVPINITIWYKIYSVIADYTFAGMRINWLDLSFNNLKSLSTYAFDNITRIEQIHLKQNLLTTDALVAMLDSFDRYDSNDLEALRVISLEINRIDRLNKTFPYNLRFLKNLYLSRNMIETISPGVFANLTSLYYLKLNENYFKIIESQQMFAGINVTLQILDMSFTQLEDPNDWYLLLCLSNLRTLELISSNLEDVFYIGRVKTLKLENNNIAALKNNSFNYWIDYINLNKNELTKVESFYFANLTYLKSLYLSGNRIEAIEQGSFDSLKSLEQLFLDENNLKSFEPGLFKNLGKVKVLDISENGIESIETCDFSGLNQVRFLNLSMNLIGKLEERSFANISTVNELRLSSQRITVIDSNAFKGALELVSLYLDGNSIEKIHANTFNHRILSLDFLNLASNDLKEIEDHAFKGLTNLSTLDLSDNYLSYLAGNSFLLRTPDLIYLYLSMNQIDSLEPNCFSNTSKLANISLDFNRLVTLPPGVFSGVENSLKILKLNSNKLQLVKYFYFDGLVQLQELYLENNQISSIDANSFNDLVNLTVLVLHSNMLFRIDSSLFVLSTNLTRLELSLNDELRIFKFKNSHLKQLVEFTMFQVNTLDNTLFSGWGRLQLLKVSECKVSFVFSNAFFNMSQLKMLYLQNNRIKSLNLSITNCGSLELLDISNNQIETLNQLEFQRSYKLNRLVMAGNRIKVFSPKDNPFSRYTLLDISNTTSQLISTLNFSLLERLLTIDLSQNDLNGRPLDLSKMSNMKRLYLSKIFQNSTITYDLATFFDPYPYLEWFVLTSARNIIFNKTVTNKLGNLRNLTIVDCNVEQFEDIRIDFTSLRNLLNVDLSQNRLKTIKKKYFLNLVNIQSLNFSRNNISMVETHSFSTQKKLSTLDLSYNQIHSLETSILFIANLFLNSNFLKFFDDLAITVTGANPMLDMYMSGNNLTTFPKSIFSNRLVCDYVDLSNNLIKELPKHRKKKTEPSFIQLVTLLLSNNQMESINEESLLTKFNKLTTLDLSNNYLSDFKINTFNQQFALKNINLSGNQLSIIPQGLFRTNGKLQSLDLSRNNIKTIQHYAFQPLVLLKILYLNSNDPALIFGAQLNDNSTDMWPYFKKAIVSNYFFDSYPSYLDILIQMFGDLKLYREVKEIKFYYSQSIDYVPNNYNYTKQDCRLMLYSIRRNIPFNMNTDLDLNGFLTKCRFLDVHLLI